MNADTNENPSLELGRFVTVLRRRWLAVVVGTLIGVLLAVAALVSTSRTATATTLVNVNVISTQPFNQARKDSDLLDAQTETQIARSTEVVTAVSRTLGGDTSPQQIRRATTAELLAGGTVLRIQYSAQSARLADRGANALADEYLTYRSDIAQAKVDAVVKQLDARRSELTDQLAGIQQRLATTSAIPTRARLQAQSEVTNQTLSSLTQQLTVLQSLDTGGGTVLTSASPASTVVSPRTWVVLATGVLGGLLLGLLLAFLVNFADRRLRDEHDVEAAGGGAVLGWLPRRGGRVDPTGEDADAVRSLRERLLATLPGPRPVVALVDLSGQEMPSNTATNLALASAGIGMNVHLVLPEHPSRYVSYLSNVLQLRPVESAHRLPLTVSALYPRVSVTLPATQMLGNDNPADQVIELLHYQDAQKFDLTVIALPPNSSRSLRLAVGRAGHAVVLTVTEGRTRTDEVTSTAAELRAVNAVVHGTVVVRREPRFRRRYKEYDDRHTSAPEREADHPIVESRTDAGAPQEEARATRSF